MTDKNRDRYLIEHTLRQELNKIFEGDAHFDRLIVQIDQPREEWEIYLEEKNKGLIPLSRTGSGLKTVLLVLANLLIVPTLDDTSSNLSQMFFGFEELENNLHPTILRRLFFYLKKVALTLNTHFFITTHSNVVIDLFSNDEHAQILHVSHNGEYAQVTQVKTDQQGYGVLDDLGIKASDVLQTNVVIWVEGPSDRIYFDKWIELWTDGELKAGVQFQCLPYGGKIASHFSFDLTEEIVNDLIPALKINRHAIVLIDRDSTKTENRINETKQRLVDEVNNVEGYAWVTEGKEIENYIPTDVIKELCDDPALKGPEKTSSVPNYIKEKTGREPNKVKLAKDVVTKLTRDSIAETLDIAEHLNAIVGIIRIWNGLETPSDCTEAAAVTDT